MKHLSLFFILSILLISESLSMLAQEVTPEVFDSAAEATPEVTGEPPENLPPLIDSTQDLIESYFSINNSSPFVGEPIELSLYVEAPSDLTITHFPEFPEENPPFFVKSVEEMTETEEDNQTTYRQIYEIVLWEAGLFNTPEIFVTYMHPEGEVSSPVRSVAFSVPSTLDMFDQTLRPRKPLIDLPYLPPWIIVVTIIMIATSIWGIRFLRSPRGNRLQFMEVGTPIQAAVSGLRDLQDQYLPAATAYPMVADHLRTYLQSRFDVRAQDMTTIELMTTLRDHAVFTNRLRSDLQRLLEQADLVKFAQFEPADNSSERIILYAIDWLEKTEKARRLYD